MSWMAGEKEGVLEFVSGVQCSSELLVQVLSEVLSIDISGLLTDRLLL